MEELMNRFQKKRYLLFFVVGIIIFASIITKVNAEESTNIVCTNSILADFTSNILIENVTIEYIMPSGVCPAFYDTCPSDVNKIVNANVIISLGSSIKEPWLVDLLDYNPDYNLIECKDLGEWNIPSGAKSYIECLKIELTKIFPELNQTIDTNTQNYLDQIDNKSKELKQTIEDAGYSGKKIICMNWHEDFNEWLGLNVTYSYGPPQGLSVQDELDIINTALNEDVYAVVDNLQSGTEFGARVASESGASHVIFTNFPQAIPGTDTYLDMISYNTEQLIKGISTYEYKQGEISNAQNQITSLEIQRNFSLAVIGILFLLLVVVFIMYKKKK
jgi:ABC-type Zn uptake system ZnuABC Zn-binding protein ZnuA